MMKAGFIGFIVLAILNGCIIKETTIKEIPRESSVSTSKSTKIKVPTQRYKGADVYSTSGYQGEPSSMSREVCEVLYTTYRQCYGLGIQLNSTDACINSGVDLAKAISQKYGSQELGKSLGSICAIACESANRNMSMPSYSDFSREACN